MSKAFKDEEESNQRQWGGGYQKLTCRANGCTFHAASGNWDGAGLCVFHAAIEDRPDAWDRMTKVLNSNDRFLAALWYAQRLALFTIDRDEKTNPRTKRLYGATEWAKRKTSDTDYLTFHARDAFLQCGLSDEEATRQKDEAPRTYALRVYSTLMRHLAEWAAPKDAKSPEQLSDEEPVCPGLSEFINKGRKAMGAK